MRLIIPLMIATLWSGCTPARKAERTVVVEFVLAETEPTDGYREIYAERLNERFYLAPQVLLSTTDIESASASERMGLPAVEIAFTEAGSKKLAEVTEANKGKRLAILIDGRLVMAPHIMEKIEDGRAVISGITDEEAKHVVAGIEKR